MYIVQFDVFSLQIRKTKRVSAWPVGFATSRWEGPIVESGIVTGFHTSWHAQRVFPLDMAGFAVNLKVLTEEKPDVQFNKTVLVGYLETALLESIGVEKKEMEPMAENCTKVRT